MNVTQRVHFVHQVSETEIVIALRPGIEHIDLRVGLGVQSRHIDW